MTEDWPPFSGTLLRELRRERGLSQYTLAQRAGVALATVREAELGRRRPQPSTVRRLAGALGVEPSDLLAEGPS